MSYFSPYQPDAHGHAASVQVREPTLDEVPVVADIWAEREGGDARAAAPLIRSEFHKIQEGALRRYVCVALIDDQVVGYGRCGYREAKDGLPEGWYLIGVIVIPSARRRGVGRALTDHRMAWLAAQGVRQVYYFTNKKNRASIALHTPHDFVEVSHAGEADRLLLQATIGTK